MYFLTCQVKITVGDSCLCCCICVTSFKHQLTPLCVDSKRTLMLQDTTKRALIFRVNLFSQATDWRIYKRQINEQWKLFITSPFSDIGAGVSGSVEELFAYYRLPAGDFSENLCMFCVVLLKSAFLITFCMFGASFWTLAVNFVFDLFNRQFSLLAIEKRKNQISGWRNAFEMSVWICVGWFKKERK